MSDDAEEQPVLRIVKGDPTPEELVAVLATLTPRAAAEDSRGPRGSGWSAYWRSVKAPLVAGPDAWRSSAHPH